LQILDGNNGKETGPLPDQTIAPLDSTHQEIGIVATGII
jgi:hypothetical protein